MISAEVEVLACLIRTHCESVKSLSETSLPSFFQDEIIERIHALRAFIPDLPTIMREFLYRETFTTLYTDETRILVEGAKLRKELLSYSLPHEKRQLMFEIASCLPFRKEVLILLAIEAFQLFLEHKKENSFESHHFPVYPTSRYIPLSALEEPSSHKTPKFHFDTTQRKRSLSFSS